MENEGGIHAGGRKSEAQSQLQEALDLGGKKGPSDPWPKDNMMQSEVLEKRSRKASWRRYWLDPPLRAGLELGWVDEGRGGFLAGTQCGQQFGCGMTHGVLWGQCGN